MGELQLLALSYVVFLGLIGVEVAVSVAKRDGIYTVGEAVVNVGHGIVFQVWDHFTKVVLMAPLLAVSALVFWPTLPMDAWWGWVLAFLAYDFMSYWTHRHHHEVGFLWAIHSAHHAAEDFNLAAGLRQAAFQYTFKWLWKLPLMLIMPWQMFVGLVVIDYLYQFLQHTRYVPKLGPIEWVFNTPSHHRVHHGRQPKYLDKNYGGMLIIWDRMFGTFQVEEEAPEVGLTKPLHSLNTLWGNVALWVELAKATKRAQGWNKAKVWFAGPAHLERLAPGGPPARPQETQHVTPALGAYVLVNMMLLPPGLGTLLLWGEAWPMALRVGMAVFLVGSVVALAWLVERKAWAVPVEVLRVLSAGAGFAFVLDSSLPLVMALAVMGALVVSQRSARARVAPA